MISFTTTNAEFDTITRIVDRAEALYRKVGHDIPFAPLMMDITATHANGCRLRLEDWLAADDLNFIHDIAGIWRHLNRVTGKLEGCFLPRFALRQGEPV